MLIMEQGREGEEEDLLNLSLTIVSQTNNGSDQRKKRKRSIKDISSPSTDHHEGKILTLLKTRDQMLETKIPTILQSGLHLIHQLLVTATEIDQNNFSSAINNLTELYSSVLLDGDSVQRVVAYFTDGLAARLLTTKSPFYEMIIKKPTQEEEFLAFTNLYKISPYYQFAHFTANQAILEEFEKELLNDDNINNRVLHVIDFDISYGFQWPSLIQSLSEYKSTSSITLRITGFGTSLEELRETEKRLVSFAKGFHNLVFEFQGLLRKSNSKLTTIKKKKNETVAVNLIFHLNTLNNESFKISDTLKLVHSINPSIIILVEQECNPNPKSFLSRFMESLHYFAAMFDSLDDCLPLESSERLSIEKNHLGKQIKNRVNYETTSNRSSLYEKTEISWKSRMEGDDKFAGIKLSSKSLIQAKLLLKIKTNYSFPISSSNGGFRVFERDDGNAICLAWQDRCLLTASAWHCV